MSRESFTATSKYSAREIVFEVILIQRRIKNPVKHLRWSVFVNTVNGFKPLTVFANISTLDI